MVEKFTNPLNTPIDNDINLFDLLDGRAQRDPEGSMVEYKDEEGRWHSFTAREFRQKVIDIAKGLIGWGITKGDAVSIIARTCWEWTALDMAIMAVGAITVPVYETNSAQQIRNIFNDSKVALAIAQDDTQRDKIESIKDEAPSLREVFMMEAGAVDAIIAFGTDVSDKEFWDRKNAVYTMLWRPSYTRQAPRGRPRVWNSAMAILRSCACPQSSTCLVWLMRPVVVYCCSCR